MVPKSRALQLRVGKDAGVTPRRSGHLTITARNWKGRGRCKPKEIGRTGTISKSDTLMTELELLT